MGWRMWMAGLVLAAPVLAAPIDPSGPGRWPVGTATVDLVDAGRARVIRTEIWYPSRAPGRNTPFARGRYPLIVFAHGNCGTRDNYEYLTTHLAAHGFVVAAPDIAGYVERDCTPNPAGTPRLDDPWQDLSYVRAAFRDRASPVGAFRALLRGQRTGVGGHSLGGVWAQNALLADKHFAVAALLATLPIEEKLRFPAPRRTTLVVGGTGDELLPYDAFSVPLFESLPAPTYLVKVVDGTHSGFTDVDDDASRSALARQQAIVARYVTALFERALAGRASSARYLTAVDAQQFGADVSLTPRRRSR